MKWIYWIVALSAFVFADWTLDAEDPAYPNALYFVAVGSSNVSPEQAVKSAQGEIARQIKVRVKSRIRDEQYSRTNSNGEVYFEETESQTEAFASQSLVGVDVVKRAEKAGVFYAMAVLDKERFHALYSEKLKEANGELQQIVQSAENAFSQSNIAFGFEKLRAAETRLFVAQEITELLFAVDFKTNQDKPLFNQVDFEKLSERIVLDFMVRQDKEGLQFLLADQSIPYFEFEIWANGILNGIYKTDEFGKFELKQLKNTALKNGNNTLEVRPVLLLSKSLKKQLLRKIPLVRYNKEIKTCGYQFVWEEGFDAWKKKKLEAMLFSSGIVFSEQGTPLFISLQERILNRIDGLSSESSLEQYQFDLILKSGEITINSSAKTLGKTKSAAMGKALENLSNSAELSNLCAN